MKSPKRITLIFVWLAMALPLTYYCLKECQTYNRYVEIETSNRNSKLAEFLVGIKKDASAENVLFLSQSYLESVKKLERSRRNYRISLGFLIACVILFTLPFTYAAIAKWSGRAKYWIKRKHRLKNTIENEVAESDETNEIRLNNLPVKEKLLQSHKGLILTITLVATVIMLSRYYITSYRPKSIATENVARNLIDPDSARFRDVRIIRNVVCGEVNAKNRQGGYTGYSSFVYLIDEEVVGMERDTENLSGTKRNDADEVNEKIHSLCN